MNARARWSRHQARWVGGFNASSYAPKIVGKVALGRKLCQFPCRALRLKPLKPINHFTAVEKSMNLGRKGANKAQERAQTLAHGHPWGLGRSLTVRPRPAQRREHQNRPLSQPIGLLRSREPTGMSTWSLLTHLTAQRHELALDVNPLNASTPCEPT